jgi:hypothetical protein
MTSAEIENLVRIGQLKREPSTKTEIDGLIRSGAARLSDAANASLSLEGRFDLAYNAAHALALAALRRLGYRSENRFLVFQTLRTRWASRRPSGESLPGATRRATWRSTRGPSTSTSVWLAT